MSKKKSSSVVGSPIIEPFIPRMSSYCGISTPGHRTIVRRRAKFAPELLADGLSTGIVSSSNTLLHGMFDEDGVNAVDPYVDIHSDKFAIMSSELQAPNFDASAVAPKETE